MGTYVLLALVLAYAAAQFYRSAGNAAELGVTPDEVEYVSGAVSLATGHGYQVDFAGRRLPSQYPPAFSVLLSPLYRLFPGNLGVGTYVELAFGLVAVTCAFSIGHRLAGPVAGALAAMAVAVQPAIATSAHAIMSDIPSLALGLFTIVLLIRSDGKHARWMIAAAAVGALAALLRPFNAFFILPALYGAFRRPVPVRPRFGVVALIAGIGVVPVVVAMLYNYRTFGEVGRDGYKFWCAVPYDYLSLEFSLKYLPVNFNVFKEKAVAPTVIAGLAAVACALWQRSKRSNIAWQQLLIFAALGALPMTMAYAVYFFPTHRMHLPLLAVFSIAAMSVLVEVIGVRVPKTFRQPAFIIVGVMLIGVGLYGRRLIHHPTVRRDAAAAIRANVPAGATVISTLDPVYFSLAADPGDTLHYLPLARSTPIAPFIMTAHRVPHPVPAPRSAFDIDCQGLVNGGAKMLFDTFAVENPELIRVASATGKPVFLDMSSTSADDPASERILKQYTWRLVDSSTRLYRLVDPTPLQ